MKKMAGVTKKTALTFLVTLFYILSISPNSQSCKSGGGSSTSHKLTQEVSVTSSLQGLEFNRK